MNPNHVNTMKKAALLSLTYALLASLTVLNAAEQSDPVFAQRREAVLAHIQANPSPSPEKSADHAAHMALLLLFKQEKMEEANRMVLTYCGADPLTTYFGKRVPKNRCETLFRIYLLERTNKLLTPEARRAIEDFAWDVLTKYHLGMSRDTVEKAELAHFLLPNNGQTNLWRRYSLALQIARKSGQYGPKAMLDGDTIESHSRAWDRFWVRFFQTFPKEGTDMDVAHPGAYGVCMVGVFYDLYDLADDPEVRCLAGNFLTLFWAEVASEFQPTTGERGGMATTRWPHYKFRGPFWANDFLYAYGWHDNDPQSTSLGNVLFLTSSYQPPAIVTAVARNKDRGCYLATSRRPGLIGGEGIEVTYTFYRGQQKLDRIVVDANGDSHYRRDVYYTPDYALGTLTTDPKRTYISDVILTPMMGATFPTSRTDRIVVMGTGYYCSRPTSGITGNAVSIIGRDPNARFGHGGRFESDGTRVFVSNGDLWNNRIEDASDWFFTLSGDAYAAIRVADGGFKVTDKSSIQVNLPDQITTKETVEKDGHFLELNAMWAPIVIQMGRAADYKSFEAFQKSVKENPFTYSDGKLTYTSEAGETFEYPANSREFPKINGQPVNLNPAKTYDSPFLSMKHGESKAVIHCAGYEDVVLDFGSPANPTTPKTQVRK